MSNVSISCFLYKQTTTLKWPDIENESMANEFQETILSVAKMKLNITFLPKYALEDAQDIVNELHEDLQTCLNNLLNDHLLLKYRICVYQQLDTTDNHIWDLKNSLRYDSSEIDDDDDSQSSSLSTLLSLIICNLIILSCFLF